MTVAPPVKTGFWRRRQVEYLSQKSDRRLAMYLLIPAVVIVCLAMGYPLVKQLIMSFQEFGLAQHFGQPPKFVWLENYSSILSTGAFWAALVRSIVFCVVCAVATMVIGTAAALLLTAVPRPVAIGVQAVMLIAWAMPTLSSLQVFQWLFDQQGGVVNYLLVHLGFSQFQGVNWLAHVVQFFIVAGLIVTWMSVPLVVFMVFAAVTQLDESTLEAARLDGAGGWSLFRWIIAPGIAPVLLLVSLMEVIWDLRVFTQIHVLQSNSGITQSTHVLGTYIYQIGLGGGNYGLAEAAAMIMLAIMLLVTAKYIQLLLRGANE